MIDTDAIRIQIDELRATITELRQDLADAEIEVGHLTDENKELTAAVKKECDDRDEVYEKFRVSEMNADTYKAEMDKRGNENTKLTEQNEQFFHEMANYKQERDTAKADLYLAEQRECVLEENNKLMREALKFYALIDNWLDNGSYSAWENSEVYADSGDKAQDALDAIKGE